MTVSKDDAIRTFWEATPAVKEVMLEQAKLNIQARLQTATALEQRVAQAGALLLAGSAVAAQLAWSLKESPATALAGMGAIAFTAGGLSALFGIKAGDLAMPGADPEWWASSEKEISGFTLDEANAWVIGHTFDAVESLHQMAERRAKFLNLGLRYGAIGSVLLAIAASLAIFR